MTRPPSEQTQSGGTSVRGRADKGRAHRFALGVPVQLEADGSWSAGVARDIGPGGIFVATVRLLDVGARVTVKLESGSDAGPIEALAEVRWCRPFVELNDLPAGVGLRFIDTPLRAAVLANELRLSRRPSAS